MAKISNGIITGLNVVTLLLALSAIGFSLYFHVNSESACQRVLKMPLLLLGIALLVVSVSGLLGSCCRISVFMWFYLLVLFLLIVGLIVFTIFTIIVTNKGVGRVLSNRGVGDHKLGDYSRWMQKYVINAENWDEIKSCLVGVRLCQSIEAGKEEEFYRQHLTPIQSGCCKPPNYCGFQFQNATFWTVPKAGPAQPDPDCKAWSNVQTQLCFDCESCKGAVLENIKREWRLLAIINVCMLVFVTMVYSVGCCALRNNKSNGGYWKHRPGP
ncbi:tetraspanin-8-like [Primulina tabacum]|uniref:tetraspanin-8-like n=1 Tax=Primulina tabacum TaxID=48773 RepID=UPI003F5928E7